MFRYFVMAFVLLLVGKFGTSRPTEKPSCLNMPDLNAIKFCLLGDRISKVQKDFVQLNTKISDLETNMRRDNSQQNIKISNLDRTTKGNTNRLNRADVYCLDETTWWTGRSDARIMNLDRHNVDCPSDYFLSRFQLKRDGHHDHSNVRYEYQCCKFRI